MITDDLAKRSKAWVYKVQISVKHNNLSYKLSLWQHVSTVLSHHQAFQRTYPIYQVLRCILGSQMFTIGSTVDTIVYVL